MKLRGILSFGFGFLNGLSWTLAIPGAKGYAMVALEIILFAAYGYCVENDV